MDKIGNFFKFLKDKEGKEIPLRYKFIYDPDSITPEDLNVKGNLDLGRSNITSLPDNLHVVGYLNLNHTNIASIPNNLKVGDNLNNLHLRNTPLSERYNPTQIRKMIEDKGGSIGGDIYL